MATRVIRLVLVRLMVVIGLSAALLAVRIHDDPEHARPPHRVRLTGVTQEVNPATDWEAAGNEQHAVEQYLKDEGERIEHERQWAEGVAEAERLARARTVAVQPVARTGTPTPVSSNCASIPAWFPQYIAWRESNCTRGINTGNGYFGYMQAAGFHWFGGACDGLTWTIPADEDECAWRLSRGGSNFAPWGA